MKRVLKAILAMSSFWWKPGMRLDRLTLGELMNQYLSELLSYLSTFKNNCYSMSYSIDFRSKNISYILQGALAWEHLWQSLVAQPVESRTIQLHPALAPKTRHRKSSYQYSILFLILILSEWGPWQLIQIWAGLLMWK